MRLALCLALPVFGAGCREELGPVAFRTTRVRGLIVEGGRPVGGGWVVFIPSDGTVGNLRTAPVGRDGRFVVSGVAVGRNHIGLDNAPIRLPDGRQTFTPLSSPIVREITPGAEVTLPTIDLLEEAIRHQKAKAELEAGAEAQDAEGRTPR
jgi:hypothetical protein